MGNNLAILYKQKELCSLEHTIIYMDEQEAEKKIKKICNQLEEEGGNPEKLLYTIYTAFTNRSKDSSKPF